MACLFGENAIPFYRVYAFLMALCVKLSCRFAASTACLPAPVWAAPAVPPCGSSRKNLVCRECVLETVLAPATALQFAVEAVKCWPIFITQIFYKLGRYSAGMCEIGISEGRGVGFYHV